MFHVKPFMLNPSEKALLIQLSRSDAFAAMKAMANDLILQWAKQGGSNNSMFECVKSAISRDAKQEGLTALFQSIEALNKDSELQLKPVTKKT